MVVNYVRKPPYHCMTRPTSACLTPRQEYRGRLVTATVLSLYSGSQAVSLTGYVTEARGGRPLTLPDKPDSYGLEYRFIRELRTRDSHGVANDTPRPHNKPDRNQVR